MSWRRGGRYYETNGTHNVCAVKVLRLEETTIGTRNTDWRGRDKGPHKNIGGALHWAYEAWRAPQGKRVPGVWLGAYDTAQEARERCERDASEHKQEGREEDRKAVDEEARKEDDGFI